MDEQVRIVRLEPMRVACASGFGPSPEGEAWDTLIGWAKSQGLLDDLDALRFFGYNNPDPSPGSPNYGYDQWVTAGPDAKHTGFFQLRLAGERHLRHDEMARISEDLFVREPHIFGGNIAHVAIPRRSRPRRGRARRRRRPRQ